MSLTTTKSKISENVDWESVKSKYGDILTLMKEELSANTDEAKKMCKDYLHTKEKFTKKLLSTKLKAIRGKFREAVDSGRRSGHGCVVLFCVSRYGVDHLPLCS